MFTKYVNVFKQGMLVGAQDRAREILPKEYHLRIELCKTISEVLALVKIYRVERSA